MRFRRNTRFERDVRRSPRFQAVRRAAARAIKQNAEAIAPHGSGTYADSIEADDSRVWTTDPAGHIVEFGSINNPAYAPLRRGARAAGLRLEDKQR